MTESNKIIKLIFRSQDFEDIYFKDRQGDIFWSTPVKQNFVIALVFISAALISLAYSLYTNQFWGIPIFLLFLFAIAFFIYAKQVSVILKWKKQVIKYLSDLAKIKKHEITLTNEALTIIQDNEVIITKWSTFTKVTLNNESISLSGNDNYFFPAISMSVNDYEYLKQFISDKVQDGL